MIKPRSLFLPLSLLLVLNNLNAASFSSVLTSLLGCMKKNNLEENAGLQKLKNAKNLLMVKDADGVVYLFIDAEKLNAATYIAALGQSISSVEQELSEYNNNMEQIINSAESGETVDFTAMESSLTSFKQDKTMLDDFLNTSAGIAKYKEYLKLIGKASLVVAGGGDPQTILNEAETVAKSIELTPENPSSESCVNTTVVPVTDNASTTTVIPVANNASTTKENKELSPEEQVNALIEGALNKQLTLDGALDLLSKAYVYADEDATLIKKIQLAEVALANSLKTQLADRITALISGAAELKTEDLKILFAINYLSEILNGKIGTAEMTALVIGTAKNNFKDGLITYQGTKAVEALTYSTEKETMRLRLKKLKVLTLGNNDSFVLLDGSVVDIVDFYASAENIMTTEAMLSGLNRSDFNNLKTELPEMIDKATEGLTKYNKILEKMEKLEMPVRK